MNRPSVERSPHPANVALQIELTPERHAMLERLKHEAGLADFQDLLANSLTLLHWAVEQRKQGKQIGTLDVDEEGPVWRELVLPFFDRMPSALD